MTSTFVRRKKAERPRSIIILVVLQFLQSIALVAYGAYRAINFGWPRQTWELSLDFLGSALVQVINSGAGLLVLGFLAIIVAWHLFGIYKYAWLMAMSLQGIILLTSLVAYLRDEANYFLMATGVILVFYLNQHEIQVVMRGKQAEI